MTAPDDQSALTLATFRFDPFGLTASPRYRGIQLRIFVGNDCRRRIDRDLHGGATRIAGLIDETCALLALANVIDLKDTAGERLGRPAGLDLAFGDRQAQHT